MTRFRIYLLAQMKRVKKALPAVLIMTLLLTGCIALISKVMLIADSSSEKKQKVQIGLVGDISGSYLGFGISALQHLDSSRFAIEFIEMEEEEARDRLNHGTLSAFVIVPEGFVEAAVRGENMPLTYVSTSGSLRLGSMIMNELVNTISSLLTESQNAIYGMQNYLVNNGMSDIYWQATDELYLRFLDFILGRTSVYELEIMGLSGNLSMIGYYLCGFTVLFLLLWGIAGSPLYIKKDHALPALLSSKGQNTLSQMAGEFVAYFVLMATSFLLVIVLVAVAMGLTGFTLPEWEREGIGILFGFYVKMLPVAAVICAMQLLLFELTSDMVSGILLQFLCALSLGYLSGCFYPISFFPESIQIVQPLLPTGVAVNYGGNLLMEESTAIEMVLLLGYLLLFLVLATAVRKRKIAGNR